MSEHVNHRQHFLGANIIQVNLEDINAGEGYNSYI